MNKSVIATAIAVSLIATTAVYADVVTVVEKPSFPVISWTSKNAYDTVTVNNGSGTPIMIAITVNGSNSTSTTIIVTPNANKPAGSTPPQVVPVTVPGVNVKNCGTTTHIDAGSSAVCFTNDAHNPVNFSSDSSTSPASGTYQIKPK